MRLRFLVALVLAGAAASACNKGLVDPADNKVDTFSAVLNPGDGHVEFFNVGRNGELAVTFKSLTPPLPLSTTPTDIRVTATVGTPAQCIFGSQIVADNQNSTPNPSIDVISGVLITPGQYCLWVVDEGFYTQAETFVVSVSHP